MVESVETIKKQRPVEVDTGRQREIKPDKKWRKW
jgi:hypothetical protein